MVLEKVRQVAADAFNLQLDDVIPESSNETIGEWDSMQHLNLILALEESFGLEFAPEEIERMLSIEAIASVIEGKLSQPV